MDDIKLTKPDRIPCPNRDTYGTPFECVGCYENRRCKGQHAGHHYYRPERPEPKLPEVECIMKRPTQAQVRASGQTTTPDEVWNKKFPTIAMYLCDDAWEDGTAREPSSLAVTVRDGMIQLALNDKDLKQSLYTSAGSFAEAMVLMEKALAMGVEAWRPWKTGTKRK